MFQKGISFLYNGQERSAAAFANIFEKEPIDWTGPDLTDVIVKMKKIKESKIFAAGTFFADEVRGGVVRAVYTRGEEKIVGLFAIGSGSVGADTGLPDGPYRNLYSGEEILNTLRKFRIKVLNRILNRILNKKTENALRVFRFKVARGGLEPSTPRV